MDDRPASIASSEKTTTVRIYDKTQKHLDEIAAGQNVSKADLIEQAVKDYVLASSGISTDKVRAFGHHLAQMKMVFMESETERARLSKAHIYSEDEFRRQLLAQKVELERETIETGAENRQLRLKLDQLQNENTALKVGRAELEAHNKRLLQSHSNLQKTVALLEQRHGELEARLAKQPLDQKEMDSLKDKLRAMEIAYAKLETHHEAVSTKLAEQKAQFEEKIDYLVRQMRAEKEAEIQKRETLMAEMRK